MISLERANSQHKVTWLSLIGLILVPVIVAAGFLAATWHAGDRLHRVQAAVVNQDEAVKVNGQLVPLGRQLAGGLVDSDEDNFDWQLVDEHEAQQGLASGRYAAVITIPSNFSKAATSFGNKDPLTAEQATIQIQTSKVSGVADSAVGQAIAEVATRTFNTTLTETYLDNVYLGFNKTQEQFTTVADGAQRLADGADGLSDGINQADKGADGLADGMGKLSEGGKGLDKGAAQLGAGATGLADGASKLSDGAGQLSDGAGKYADGVGQYSDGVTKYTGGVKKYAGGVKQYTGGVHQLSGGADQLAGGIRQFKQGLDSGLSQVPQTGQADPQQLVDGVKGVNKTMHAIADEVDATAKDGGSDPNQYCQSQASRHPTAQADADSELCQAYRAGQANAAQRVQAYLNAPVGRSGLTILQIGDQVAAGTQKFVDAIGDLPSQLAKLKAGVDQLSQGADQLAAGVSKLDAAGTKLNDAGTQLSTGGDKLAKGGPKLVDGANQLSGGARKLSGGASQFSDGAGKYATGVNQFAVGLDEYTDGIDKTADGTRKFADGMDKLSDGGQKLSDGTGKFASELRKGATKVPTYDGSERAALKTVVANPVADADASTQNLISETPATTLLMILALWLGGLATFLVVQAVSARTVLSSRPSWQLALRAVAPGAAIATIQAIALTIVGQIVLDLSPAKVVSVLALLLLTGYVFVGINHALAAWLGGLGRLISVTLVVLTAAGSITSAVPGFFDAVLPYSPLTPGLAAVRSVITDGGGLAGPIALLLAWLLIAIVASVGAVLRKRTLRPAQLLAQQT